LFEKWKMKANESKSIDVTFTTGRETCSPDNINNVQLTPKEDVKYSYLGPHLDQETYLA
jgi:hypothetical protein